MPNTPEVCWGVKNKLVTWPDPPSVWVWLREALKLNELDGSEDDVVSGDITSDSSDVDVLGGLWRMRACCSLLLVLGGIRKQRWALFQGWMRKHSKSAHPPIWRACKVQRPWAHFRKSTVLYVNHINTQWKSANISSSASLIIHIWSNSVLLVKVAKALMLLILKKWVSAYSSSYVFQNPMILSRAMSAVGFC